MSASEFSLPAIRRSVAVLALIVAPAGVFGACQGTSPSDDVPAPAPLSVSRESSSEVETIDADAGALVPRWSRRIRIDNLQASLPLIAGPDAQGKPIRWLVKGFDGKDHDAFGDYKTAFGVALGRPDYRVRVEETTTSNAIYAKLMRDMAVDVCKQMADADLARSDGVERHLTRYAPLDGGVTDEQRTENLQYLVLRFLGLDVGPDHVLVTNLREVFDAGVSSSELDSSHRMAQAEGWRGVCIALFQSPAFHID